MRVKAVISALLVTGFGLALSACVVAPAYPGYGYYDSGYYYGGPAYYGPSVGFYYGGGGGWHRNWDSDRRWR